jgi:4-hydroxybenzoate polyprenyltransferase
MGAASEAPPGWVARVRAVLDERDPAGGPFAAALFVVHPGPSLLVTAVAVATAGLLTGATPGAGTALRIAFIVLPAQLATGAANDLADVDADRVAKAHKPLVRGALSTRLPTAIVLAGSAASLAVALATGWAPLGFAALGLGAGLAYDAGLKRRPIATLAWWAGFSALPLGAAAVAGALRPALAWCVPLCALLAIAVHGANALPDVEGDRASGLRSWPVLLGAGGTRVVVAIAAAGVALLVLTLRGPLAQDGVLLPACAAGYAAVAFALMTVAPASRRAFPPLAALSALLAVVWLGSLPR